MRQIKLWCSCGTAVVAPEKEWGKAHKCPGCTHILRAPIPDDLGRIAEIFCPVCGEVVRFRPDLPAVTVDCPAGHTVRIPLLLGQKLPSHRALEHDPNKLLIRCEACRKLHRVSRRAAQGPVPCRQCGALLPLPEPSPVVGRDAAQAALAVPEEMPSEEWLVEFESDDDADVVDEPPIGDWESASRGKGRGWRARSDGPRRPAPPLLRLAAYLIDVLPLALLIGAGMFLAEGDALRAAARRDRSPQALARLAQAQGRASSTTFFVYLIYAAVLEGATGATLGKRLLGLRVTTAEGEPIGFGRAAARNAAKIVSLLCCGLGYVWALFQPEGRAWHDLMCGTAVMSR